jgi:Cu2+-exporting ATPase
MIAVPLAVMGYVTPLIAALAMSGSSLLVTINALRINAPALSLRPPAWKRKATMPSPTAISG